jgi:hypothetical protein
MYQNMSENREMYILYANCLLSTITMVVMVVVACTLTPVALDAGILIRDVGVLMPEVGELIPEGRRTTKMLGTMIPSIKRGMAILGQLCEQDGGCH